MSGDDQLPARQEGDLSVTALYTSGVWSWAGLPGAELYASRESKGVFDATELFVGIARWLKGGPSLKHSLVQRHVLIDRCLEAASPDTVVELAAGLSRRGAHYSGLEDGPRAYVEVDLPPVIARKESLLARTDVGQEVLARPGLRRMGADVRELELAPLLGERPVVIAEGLLMYLEAPAQRALWARIAEALQGRSGVLLFDLVPAIEQPAPGWIGRLLGWLMRRFTRGQGFVEDARTREDIRDELVAAGFAEVRWLEPRDLRDAGMPHLDVETQTLVFECRSAGKRP